MSPERLAELREDCHKAIENEWHIVRLDPKELLDLLDAADTLNALLAAAEGCLHNYDVDVKEGAFYMEQEHDQFDILRAAIRRAKGEQP